MHDIKKVDFAVGDVVNNEGDNFRRVVFVGKEMIITASCCSTLKDAQETEGSGFSWSQEEIDRFEFLIVKRRPLGVYDKNKNEWHYGDRDEQGRFVFDGIKSRNGDEGNYILVEDRRLTNGWRSQISSYHTITPSPSISMITIKGKGFSYSSSPSRNAAKEIVETIIEALKKYVE